MFINKGLLLALLSCVSDIAQVFTHFAAIVFLEIIYTLSHFVRQIIC